MNILLDSNSFNFLFDNQDKIKKIKTNLKFFYILSQELELNKIKNFELKQKLIEIKCTYTNEKAGLFMLNAPCINRNCLFPNNVLVENIKQVLIKHGCKKNNREENFNHDLNLAISGYLNNCIILTNDGAKNKKGLYKALKELNIQCLSHSEFTEQFL